MPDENGNLIKGKKEIVVTGRLQSNSRSLAATSRVATGLRAAFLIICKSCSGPAKAGAASLILSPGSLTELANYF